MRRWRGKLFLFTIMAILFYHLYQFTGSVDDSAEVQTHSYLNFPHLLPVRDAYQPPERFVNAIRSRAINNTIILALVDKGYTEMALNLYMTSFLKLSITNYLFIGLDPYSCKELTEEGAACVAIGYHATKAGTSKWGTEAFNTKTHIKTRVILDTLELGYNALLTDVDVILFKKPLDHFHCTDCALEITDDNKTVNSGFYLARPSSQEIFREAWRHSEGDIGKGLNDQQVMHCVIAVMKQDNKTNVNLLNRHQFPNGLDYFETGRRLFAGDYRPCEQCVMVHNNWILTQAAKRYRFKESGLWAVDSHAYYSHPFRRYLMYDNPADFGMTRTRIEEKEALKAALYIGHVLNRTVILPKFHCNGCLGPRCPRGTPYCPLHALFFMEDFDQYIGEEYYREHSFLQHELVPLTIRNSITRNFLIQSNVLTNPRYEERLQHVFDDVKVRYHPANISNGITRDEILKWFGEYDNVSILRFHSLYGAFPKWDTLLTDRHFKERLYLAFVNTDYRQLKNIVKGEPEVPPPKVWSNLTQCLDHAASQGKLTWSKDVLY